MTEDWYNEDFRNENRFSLRVTDRLFEGQSPFQKVEVIDTASFGRVLAIDGVFMTSERDEHLYHEMIVHPALATAPSIERVLVIGGGDGGTVREVLRYPEVKSVLMIEIDPLVVEASKKYLPKIGTAWEDSRLEVRFEDGIKYVAETNEAPFDVVILDGTDPLGPGEGLFNEAFYRGVHRVLKPKGVFVLQSESAFLTPNLFREIQITLRRVFSNVRPYFGSVPLYGAGPWSWTYASDGGDSRSVKNARLDAFRGQLKVYNPELHEASFVQPNYVRSLVCK